MCDFCDGDHPTPDLKDVRAAIRTLLNIDSGDDITTVKLSREGVIESFVGMSDTFKQLADFAREAKDNPTMDDLAFYFNTMKAMEQIEKAINLNLAMVESKVRELADEEEKKKQAENN